MANYTLEQLDIVATKLYDIEAPLSIWCSVFGYDELVALWNGFCVMTAESTYTAAYDDEVYDVLETKYNHFSQAREAAHA